MKPKRASFLTSAADRGGFPAPGAPEIAFAGRSNVGKSSLINTLAGVDKLARTSNTPGRTRLINWFEIEAQSTTLAFVDLPGYGYAKVSRATRDNWRPLIESYLSGREVLRLVLVLIDARRGAETEEAELLEWLVAEDIPAQVVLTKSDKIPKAKRKPMAMQVKRDLGLARAPILFSAQTGEGAAELWRAILRSV